MITIQRIRKIIEAGNTFSIRFWDKNGDIVNAENVTCTSSFYRTNTINILFPDSGETRTVRVWSIFEFNGMEVAL